MRPFAFSGQLNTFCSCGVSSACALVAAFADAPCLSNLAASSAGAASIYVPGGRV